MNMAVPPRWAVSVSLRSVNEMEFHIIMCAFRKYQSSDCFDHNSAKLRVKSC
jgi:hypothetical protein